MVDRTRFWWYLKTENLADDYLGTSILTFKKYFDFVKVSFSSRPCSPCWHVTRTSCSKVERVDTRLRWLWGRDGSGTYRVQPLEFSPFWNSDRTPASVWVCLSHAQWLASACTRNSHSWNLGIIFGSCRRDTHLNIWLWFMNLDGPEGI